MKIDSKNQRFTASGCKDKGIRNWINQFLWPIIDYEQNIYQIYTTKIYIKYIQPKYLSNIYNQNIYLIYTTKIYIKYIQPKYISKRYKHVYENVYQYL